MADPTDSPQPVVTPPSFGSYWPWILGAAALLYFVGEPRGWFDADTSDAGVEDEDEDDDEEPVRVERLDTVMRRSRARRRRDRV